MTFTYRWVLCAAIWSCIGVTACHRGAERRQAVEAQLVKAELQADAMNEAWHVALADQARAAVPAEAPPCAVPGVTPRAPGN